MKHGDKILKSALGSFKSKGVGVICLYIAPCVFASLLTFFWWNRVPDANTILTITSIFTGFYLTLLVTINGKIATINSKDISNDTQKYYALRYVKFSKEFTSIVVLGLVSILLSSVFEGLNYIAWRYCLLRVGFQFLFYLSSSYFFILLIQTTSILYLFLKEDFRQKNDELNSIKFNKDDE